MEKGKDKIHLRIGHESPEGEHTSTLSSTSPLDGVGKRHDPSALYPRERQPVPTVQEAERTPGPVWTSAKNLTASGIDPKNVQPVASRYTD